MYHFFSAYTAHFTSQISYNTFSYQRVHNEFMDYGWSSSSNPIGDEPGIVDIVDEFTSDDFYEDNPHDQEIVPVPSMGYNPYGEVEEREQMHFDSK